MQRNQKGDYHRIITQTGVNDLDHSSRKQVQNKLVQTMKAAKEYHPNSEVFITSILPENGEQDYRSDINQFIDGQAQRLGCNFVNTVQCFQNKPSLFRDRKHPNYAGADLLLSTIRSSLGYCMHVYERRNKDCTP